MIWQTIAVLAVLALAVAFAALVVLGIQYDALKREHSGPTYRRAAL